MGVCFVVSVPLVSWYVFVFPSASVIRSVELAYDVPSWLL